MIKRGPFGFWMGMSVSEFDGNLVEVAPYKYKTLLPPRPHSAFEAYFLQITPNSGLSWIKAIGKDIVTNGFGYEVNAAFVAMESKLKASYGQNEKTDLLLPGSIWDQPREWMQALQKKERILASTWEQKSGAKLGEALLSIFLGATALNTELGCIAIEYSFENLSESEFEISSAEDDAL